MAVLPLLLRSSEIQPVLRVCLRKHTLVPSTAFETLL